MAVRSTLAGKEVPVIGSDSIRWIELSVPFSSTTVTAAEGGFNTTLRLPADDCCSCCFTGYPSAYLIWRIHKTQPHAIELTEFSASKEFPKFGLRISFAEALCPFAFVCKDEITADRRSHYLLYVLTAPGVAYLLKIRNISTYCSPSIFPREELIELNLSGYCKDVAVTCVTATAGCLIVGRSDGSVSYFQLGLLDQGDPDFACELRDDSGISRLWGFMSRGKGIAAVQDLVISDVNGQQCVFVLHIDGILRVWDLASNSRVFCQSLTDTTLTGSGMVKLWVGKPNLNTIHLALLYKHPMEFSSEIINIYDIRCTPGDRLSMSLEPSAQSIPLEEGGCIDVKVTSEMIWILKDEELLSHAYDRNHIEEESKSYALQEEFVADQLFQGTENPSDDLLRVMHSIFSSAKDNVVPLVSSIFLRRLLLPGVLNNTALHATFAEYNRHLSESELQLLTSEGLKKEILSLIEHEFGNGKVSISYCWRNFSTRYLHNWCRHNAPGGLFVDSHGGCVGLIRKNSLSVFRGLEDMECIVEGSSDEVSELSNLVGLFDGGLEFELLGEALRCIMSFGQQLGKTASAVLYESLISTSSFTSDDVIPCIMNVLKNGASGAKLHANIPGSHIHPVKDLADHRNIRKFSIDMFISLQAVCKKAGSWSRLLDVIESFLKFLVPKKITHKPGAEIPFSINTSLLVQATSQVGKVMFEYAVDFLLFLSYLVDVGGQLNLSYDDIIRVQLELVPTIQATIFEWFIISFFAQTPSVPAVVEDFSTKLSSLHIDGNSGKRSWNEQVGKFGFTLAFILLLNNGSLSTEQIHLSTQCLLSMHSIIKGIQGFVSWIIYGHAGKSSAFLSWSTDLALVLCRNGQYSAAEYLLIIIDAHSRKEKSSESIQDADSGWYVLHHLLGCCLLAQVQCGLQGKPKEKKVFDAICCFFRASSGKVASPVFQNLSLGAGFPQLDCTVGTSVAAWKLHYFQWVMQAFEQYHVSEGALQFALAALEQVDAFHPNVNDQDTDLENELISIKGRLWTNAFKFSLDLSRYYDAYCAIVSNPDEESKNICLRQFVIVLHEKNALKVLCANQLPLIGLTERVEQELSWKAERSDIFAKPSTYKLLYAFEMHRHNWRRAASYMYLYSARLRTESLGDHQRSSLVLQERLHGLSAAVNALHLVRPAHAWIENERSLRTVEYPNKRVKRNTEESSCDDAVHCGSNSYIDMEELEKEFVLTSAELVLSNANIKCTFSGTGKAPSDLVDLLVHTDLYDMAFTVVLKFFKDSLRKKGLERIFSAIALKCCPHKADSSLVETHGRLLPSTKGELILRGSTVEHPTKQNDRSDYWTLLEIYLEKYKEFHARLPFVIAETLLRADPQIELPLWLVRIFKEGQGERMWGMAGHESSPASLFRLYVNSGRYTEATNLLLEFIESFRLTGHREKRLDVLDSNSKVYKAQHWLIVNRLASFLPTVSGTISSLKLKNDAVVNMIQRPADIVKRKRPFAVWFPCTTIGQLLSQLEDLIRAGHMVDQCEKLRKSLLGALQSHLKLLQTDSDDALAALQQHQR